MNYSKLNEILESYINEISDETKASYLAKRQAQVKDAENRYYSAQADLETQKQKLNKADKMLNKSDLNQISKFPDKTDLDIARAMLNTLKSKMKKVDDPRDWEIEEIQDGNYHALNLYVRGWGEWVEREEDDDQAPLSDKYKSILQKILIEVQKQYGIKIINQGSEKKGLSFDVIIENTLENPKFREWLEDFYSEFYEISLYSDDPYIDIIIGSPEIKEPVLVTVRAGDGGDIYVDEVFNHIPSIEEIKQFAESEYPNIKNWNIPNIPNELVSKWNNLIKDETFMNNIPHKFEKWKLVIDDDFQFVWTTVDTLFKNDYHAINLEVAKKDNDKYTVILYTHDCPDSIYNDKPEIQTFNNIPTKIELIDFCKKGTLWKKYKDVDFDSIPEIPKRMEMKLQEA